MAVRKAATAMRPNIGLFGQRTESRLDFRSRARDRDRDGSVLRYAGVDIDVTERKTARGGRVSSRVDCRIVRRRHSEHGSGRRHRQLTTARPGLYGYAPEEIIGKPVTVLIPEDRHDEEPGIIDRIRRGQRLDHYETVRRRRTAPRRNIAERRPSGSSGGRVIGASKISQRHFRAAASGSAGALCSGK